MSKLTYQFETCFQTDIGHYRSQNEDSIDCFRIADKKNGGSEELLAILADGMGGHQGGKVASNLAVERVGNIFMSQSHAYTDSISLLKSSLISANQVIFLHGNNDPKLKGMGSTCTVLYIKDDQAGFAHIGDSRLYCLRDKMLRLLTEDHTLVNALLKDGLINADEARKHPDRSIVTRALGTAENVDISTSDGLFALQSGDIFLLCSDGLYDLVDDDEIRQALIDYLPQSAASHLIDLANERGGYDNISVGIIAVHDAMLDIYRDVKPRETSPAKL